MNITNRLPLLSLVILFLLLNILPSCQQQTQEETRIPEKIKEYPQGEKHDKDEIDLKLAEWTVEDAARQQAMLAKYNPKRRSDLKARGNLESFGNLQGRWENRAPKNMPGAFKFAELLDGTDTIYAVTLNHYSGEYNSKSYIFKGTIYNPATGTKGDDFIRLTGHWPNRYKDLIAFKHNGQTRLVAGIENGPVYYSDDEGGNWSLASGLPSVLSSTIMNRQDDLIYTTDGATVYVSTDGGTSFSSLENFGGSADATLYSPRYDVQPNADKVYLAREGSFYELNSAKTSFDFKGSYSGNHGSSAFSIGGDSRKLYVTEGKRYWSSTNDGVTWTEKFPKGNWYGDRTGAMSPGIALAVSPENTDHVCGGYAQPVFSTDGLTTDNSTTGGWGNYQNGTSLSAEDYYDRIRFNYHPDFQAHQFFYNSTGTLFSVGSTDGGLFMSYKVWYDHPTTGNYDNSGYADAHFINLNTINTPCALIYRHNMFTGNQDNTHVNYSTQDQGSQSIITGTSGSLLDVYQSIGGDGPPLNSADGDWVWRWQREGSEVWAPAQLYNGSTRKSVGSVNGDANSNSSTTFTKSTRVGWIQTYIDRDEPDKRMWLLGRRLDRATVSGTSISGSSISEGTTHQVCAFTQATVNPNNVWFLQEGIVYKSTNRGDSYDGGTNTPFTKTNNNQNMGSGWVLPGNDNWVLFAGPSANGIGAILSKDGGQTWTDITGDFPSGDDFQVGGMTGTPDGKYVFAGTDVGPFVFEVATETWHPMFGGDAAMFNTTDIEYIPASNTVRFGTWGSGVWDFAIEDNSPYLNFNAITNTTTCDSLIVDWTTNIPGAGTLKLYQGHNELESWEIDDVAIEHFGWFVPDAQLVSSDYTVELHIDNTAHISLEFNITQPQATLNHTRLTVVSFDSEENGTTRAAATTTDGDNSTFWHSAWSASQPPFPHEIIYQADTSATWTSFSYLPRQDGSSHGRVKAYEVYGSNDNMNNWTLLKSGDLTNQSTIQTIEFDNTLNCDYIRFVMLSEQTGAFYASMAEFNLQYGVSCDDGIVTNTFSHQDVVGHIYPTRISANTVISIKRNISSSAVLRIMNQKGQVVDQAKIQDRLYKHQINALPKGIYTVIVEGDDGFSEKVIVE